MGEMGEPWGTPASIVFDEDFSSSILTWNDLFEMKEWISFIRAMENLSF